jgi:PAS domain S-box-containing protein
VGVEQLIIRPTGQERMFGIDEVIVSKTDLKGRLTYVNDLFLRIADYDEDQVLGRPHNLIRHPDMPRLVFAMLWDEIQAGREIFAYVVNLAANGDHYWVLAHVTPTIVDGHTIGYHSNRRAPDRGAVDRISAVYAQLLAAERPHRLPSDAIDSSRAVLDELLAQHEVDYDRFVWSLAGSAVQ